jgi:hypothetical protein
MGLFLTNFRLTGHFEKIPYDKSTVRSCYHIREYDVFRLRHVRFFLFFFFFLPFFLFLPLLIRCTGLLIFWTPAPLQLTPRPTRRSIKGKEKATIDGTTVNGGENDDDSPPIDIFLSHDWPVTVTRYGDENALLRRKSFFAEEVRESEA